MPLIYTGIGSRETPADVLSSMTKIGKWLGARGWLLRSGHADGADLAFERGAREANSEADLYLPWASFNANRGLGNTERVRLYTEPTGFALKHWHQFHPAPSACSQGAAKLHARNVHQIIGYDYPIKPSLCVICWTKDGAESGDRTSRDTGGTGTAIRIASFYNIPVFNLANDDGMARAWTFVADAMRANAA